MDIKTSPLVAMAREAKHPTPWWLAWPVGIAIIFGGLILGDLLGQAILGNPDKANPIYQFIDITGFGMIVLLLALWLRLKEGRAFSSIGLRGTNPVGKLAGGLAIGAAMMTLGVVVPWAMGQYELGASEHARLGMDALLWLIPLFAVFILQGSTEELVLRGYMLQTGGLQMPGLAAIVGTSVLFSAMHRDFDPIPFINIVLYALFACFVALADGNLWRICGIHAGWNFFQGNVFGLPVSGNTEGTSLWNFGPAQGSNVAITGGNFGVEASLMGTAVLTISLVVAVWSYRTRARQRH